jgi:hypothetical protein
MSEANSIFKVKWRIVSLLKEDMSSIKYCVVESGFEPWSSQTKDYKIGIYKDEIFALNVQTMFSFIFL